MKKMLVTSLALGIMAIAGSAFAASVTYTPGAGIVGSVHDLSSGGVGAVYPTNDPQDRICVVCHAPHHALKPADYAATDFQYLPLWNHELTTNTDWIMYSAGFDTPLSGGHASYSTEMGGLAPGGVSLLCLSCHDGTVAPNTYGFTPSSSTNVADVATYGFGATNTTYLIGGGGDLSNHHPIGFSYEGAQLEDNEIAPSSTSINTGVKTIADLLYSDKMECVTCHDVHNTENEGEKLLWVSNDQSAFCCTCHLKCE